MLRVIVLGACLIMSSAAPALSSGHAQSGRTMLSAHGFMFDNLVGNTFAVPNTNVNVRVTSLATGDCDTLIMGQYNGRRLNLRIDWRRIEMVNDGGSMDNGSQIILHGDVRFSSDTGDATWDYVSFTVQPVSMRNRLMEAMGFIMERCYEEREGF